LKFGERSSGLLEKKRKPERKTEREKEKEKEREREASTHQLKEAQIYMYVCTYLPGDTRLITLPWNGGLIGLCFG